MATRTALLNGNVINRDTDFSKYIEAVSEPGVIEGLAVSSTSVAIGKAFVKCERTNGDIIYAVVYNNSAQTISGNGDVYIEIPQELIDNGELAPEDGSGIAEIKVGTMPSKNALKLATKNGNTITDERNIIKKVGQLNALIQQSNTDIEDLDERVETLEEASAITHLEESGLAGEVYTLNDTLYKQLTPKYSECGTDCNVGDVADNTQIHIQRMGSKTASNQLKLKIKKVGEPTQNLIVEVREGTKVETEEEAYWYGSTTIASGSIAYSNITTEYQEFTITLNNSFGGDRGELLDVVVRQNNDTVNSTNYYCIACDNGQFGEAFSYVSVNGTTRVRSTLMPYCESEGFEDSAISKLGVMNVVQKDSTATEHQSSSSSTIWTSAVVASAGIYKIKFKARVLDITGGRYYQVRARYNYGSGYSDQYSDYIQVNTLTDEEYVIENMYMEAGAKLLLVGNYTGGANKLYLGEKKVGFPGNGVEGATDIYAQAEVLKDTVYSFSGTPGKVVIEYKISSSSSSYSETFTVSKNGVGFYSDSVKGTTATKTTPPIELEATDVLSRTQTNTRSDPTNYYVKNLVIKSYAKPVPLTAKEIKPIGTLTSATSFGSVNGKFKGGLIVGDTSEVTTGDITLGNAVGFLKINYNGNIVKVPYYL